ncbi:hypothetical protein [Reyranella sp.]|uniref:hypothetical protein n=1 Tax=Reyranella sp. TaxID=1929291 RepID=UPI003BA878BC
MPSFPRWLILPLAAAVVLLGVAAQMGWLRDPTLAKADYAGNIDVSAEEARSYRDVPFEWRVNGPAGSFTGRDIARLRIDPSGERTVICGWLRLDKGGQSTRASRWLSEAHLIAGTLKLTAQFIAPADKAPGDGLTAGCLRIDEPGHLASDAPLRLEGAPVRE